MYKYVLRGCSDFTIFVSRPFKHFATCARWAVKVGLEKGAKSATIEYDGRTFATLAGWVLDKDYHEGL